MSPWNDDVQWVAPAARTSDAPMEHELKAWSLYFTPVLDGRKTFEVRKYDRPFRTGDTLWLREWDVDNGYTGREMRRQVTWFMSGGPFLPFDLCVMGLDDPRKAALEAKLLEHERALYGILKVVEGYGWLARGERGSYAYNDDRYYQEIKNAFEKIDMLASPALATSVSIPLDLIALRDHVRTLKEELSLLKASQPCPKP